MIIRLAHLMVNCRSSYHIVDEQQIHSFDLIIDFSVADKVNDWLDFAVKFNTPIVIATTGLSDETMEKMKEEAHIKAQATKAGEQSHV